jgi:putative sigma-54 modulation protein
MSEFDINKIQLTIQAPDLTIDGPFNDLLLEHVEKLGSLFNRITKCEVMLRPESSRKNLMEADVKIFIPGNMLYATGKNEDLRSAVIEAFHDIQQQLHKFKEKLKDHHPEQATKLTAADITDDETASQ